ncbi:MAG: hypothetical protein M3H12_07760 [Chromatiales bacterium]|nr:hypothetical protein [Gammaproteobacteria bacterium]
MQTQYSPEPARAEFIDHKLDITQDAEIAARVLFDPSYFDVPHMCQKQADQLFGASLFPAAGTPDAHLLEFLWATTKAHL